MRMSFPMTIFMRICPIMSLILHRLHQNGDNESEGGAAADDDDNLPLFLHRRGTQRLDLDWAEDNYRPRANQTEFVQPVGPTRQHDGRMNNPPRQEK